VSRTRQAEKPLAVVVGSGFGGAVCALRLVETGALNVLLLERGHRYQASDFPRLKLPEAWTDVVELVNSKLLPVASRFSWRLDRGLWELRNLGGLRAAHAAGYGGGSLIYAGVHLRPPAKAFEGWPRHRCGDPGCSVCLARGAAPAIDGELLRGYYERVEHMLGVAPAPDGWRKSEEFSSACRKLGRAAFRPPLAINFAPRHDPRSGRDRPACNGCGNCIIGCSVGAKNTLDLNYLSYAEQEGLRVRTLAEVTTLEALPEGARASYRVHYEDHFFGGKPEVLDADYVFLCAGAIGSSEILRRSLDAGHLDARRSSRSAPGNSERAQGLAHLGARFWANGDSVGVVFDTEREWRSSAGSTITSSVFHRVSPGQPGPTAVATPGSSGDQPWFLVQEGGIPPSLRRALGILRSPLWLGRNLLSRSLRAAEPLASTRAAESDTGTRSLRERLPALLGAWRRARELAPSPGSAPSRASRASDQFWTALLPPALREHVGLLDLHGSVSRELAAMLVRFHDELANEPGQALPVRLVRWFGRRYFEQESFTRVTLRALKSRVPELGALLAPGSAAELLQRLASTVLVGADPGARMAVLLGMGPDSEWRLDWQAARRTPGAGPRVRPGSLQATPVDATRVARLQRAQERAMRDIAAEAGGELRSNPDWALGDRPVTVHAQGGCCLGGTAEEGVVDPCGEVWNQPGLFVMDGSVFPASVGVNPSSTIAALAELNIEHFIARELGVPALAEEPPAPAHAGAALHVACVELERSAAAAPGGATAVQLGWEEWLDGHVTACELPLDSEPARYEAACQRGVGQGTSLQVHLQPLIEDLDEFLLAADKSIALRGSVRLRPAPGAPKSEYRLLDGSRLLMQLEPGRDPSTLGPWSRVGALRAAPATMQYTLLLAGSDGRPELVLRGIKYLREDAGLDAWMDLSTVYTSIQRHSAEPEQQRTLYAGVMRVHLGDFVRRQLPTFSVSGSNGGDAELPSSTKLSGLLRFGRYLLSSLHDVYGPLRL